MKKLFHTIMATIYLFISNNSKDYKKCLKYANKSSYHDFMANYPYYKG